MDSFLDILIVLILAQLTIYFSRILINQLGKYVSPPVKLHLYLIVALFPLFEIIRLLIKYQLQFYRFSFLYFWVIFLAGMLSLFIIESKKSKIKNN